MEKNYIKHVDLISQTIEAPEYWGNVLAALIEDCDLAAALFFLESEEHPDEPLALYSEGISEAMLNKYFREYFKKRILMGQLAQRPRGQFWNLVELGDNWAETPIYKEWCLAQGLVNIIACLIDLPGNLTLRLHFLSSVEQGMITSEQKAYLDLLVHHMQRAVDLHQQLSLSKAYYKAATYFIECFPTGAILLDELKKPVYINQEARALCEKSDLVDVSNGQLRLINSKQQEELNLLLSECVEETDRTLSSTTLIVRNGDDSPAIEFNFQPFDTEEYRFGREYRRPLVMLKMRDVTNSRLVNGDALVKLFKLTKKEVELALMLASGSSLEQISDETCTSLNTVRTHLKSLFRKTSSNSQQQLVIKLLSVI